MLPNPCGSLLSRSHEASYLSQTTYKHYFFSVAVIKLVWSLPVICGQGSLPRMIATKHLYSKYGQQALLSCILALARYLWIPSNMMLIKRPMYISKNMQILDKYAQTMQKMFPNLFKISLINHKYAFKKLKRT